MSTRCNIIVKDRYDRFWLYHHHDGYPEGVGEDLKKRMTKVFNEWSGNRLYSEDIVNMLVKDGDDEYEITTSEHGDIEYLYTIDLEKRTLSYQAVGRHWKENGTDLQVNYSKRIYIIGERS